MPTSASRSELKTSTSVSHHRDVMRLETILDSNALVTQRLSTSQLSLEAMSDAAQQMLEAFIVANGTDDAPKLTVMRRDVEASLDIFTSSVNTSVNGEYLFSGINSDVKPVADYLEAGSAPKPPLMHSFLGHFGFTQDDPAAATITAQMDNFLDTVLEPDLHRTELEHQLVECVRYQYRAASAAMRLSIQV
jgi:flagellar hook-associated protein 3 FlgL